MACYVRGRVTDQYSTHLNLGFSSVFLREVLSCRVKVEASHSLTSCGTASGSTSDSSSSSSPTWRLWWRDTHTTVTHSPASSLFAMDLLVCCRRLVVFSSVSPALLPPKLAIQSLHGPQIQIMIYRKGLSVGYS